MNNYEDRKCAWGYMTLCDDCKDHAPRHVDTSKVVEGFPMEKCEMCDCSCHRLPKYDMDGSYFVGVCKACEARATDAGYDRYARGEV